jgi:hypothetical protein
MLKTLLKCVGQSEKFSALCPDCNIMLVFFCSVCVLKIDN